MKTEFKVIEPVVAWVAFSPQERHFEQALNFTLKHEGGLSTYPADRGNRGGNATNFGITQQTYNAFRREQGLPLRNTRELLQEEARTIYYEKFWKVSKSDILPHPLSMIHFDTAVNIGPARANKMLQDSLGVTPDGIIGPVTKRALLKSDKQQIVKEYLNLREQYYRDIASSGNNRVFLKGWLNRVQDLRRAIRETLS